MIEFEVTKMGKKTNKNLDFVLSIDKMRHVLEDHIPYMKSRAVPHRVDPALAHRFHHDIHGYLTEVGVPLGKQWFILRLNDMLYPWDFHEDIEMLAFPNDEDIDTIVGQTQASLMIR